MQAISAQDTMDSQDGDLTVPRAKGRLMADPSDDSDGDDGGRRRSHPHRARSPTSEAHSQASAAQRCREEDDDDVTRRSQQCLTTISHVSLPYLIYISPATCQLKRARPAHTGSPLSSRAWRRAHWPGASQHFAGMEGDSEMARRFQGAPHVQWYLFNGLFYTK